MGPTGNISREIEIKLRLESFADYLKLLGFFGEIENEDCHVTGYFDTEDRILAADGWALRVRAENARGLITLKGRSSRTGITAIRDEIEAEIPRSQALEILGLQRDLMTLSHPPVDFVKESWGDLALTKLVHLENLRRKKSFRIADHNYVLELDKTEFSDGSVDYELELELPDESLIETVEYKLRRIFDTLGISFAAQSESKLSRALQRAGLE
ncbi:MAG TPA: CYTH domain-containing protein [Candidatus Deferrimicrobium sp.]|nr:CYTH domain-containing protein [Candidatus Deferrimicrobium sp.]